MDDVRHASLDDTNNDTWHVGRGLGKGSGVLLPRVTAFFLAKDAFGHDVGNCAIVAGYPGKRMTRDSGFVVVGASDASVPICR